MKCRAPRAHANTWHIRLVGSAWLTGGANIERKEKWKWMTGGGHISLRKGVNLLLTIANWGFVKKEHKGSMLQLAKLRVVRGAKARPYLVVFCRGANKEGAIPIFHPQVSKVWSRESSIHKLMSWELQKALALRLGCGCMEVKTHTWYTWCRWSFHEGPVDWICRRFQQGMERVT